MKIMNGRRLLLTLLASVLLAVVQQFVTDLLLPNDAEIYYDAIEMMSSKGYAAEVHNATTRDGYVLTIHRMSQRINNTNLAGVTTRQVVLLMHCVMCSSMDWLMNDRKNSLAYLLADAGFDVWLANVRGNTYSKVHTKYTTKDRQFWNFSWQEHALLDLPAIIHYIQRETNQQQLYYVGHSQGTTLAFAAFSADQKLASKIKHVYALAPVTDLNHTKGILWLMSKTITPIRITINNTITRYGEFNVDGVFNRLSSAFCSTTLFRAFCAQGVLSFAGGTGENLNKTRIPVYIRHTPAPTSVKNMHHWSQLTHSDFCKYDYESRIMNQVHYGQSSPPCFNMSHYQVPTTLYSGGRDWIATPKQLTRIVDQLKHVLTLHKHIPHYGHIDFLWGMDAASELYNSIIKHMKNSI